MTSWHHIHGLSKNDNNLMHLYYQRKNMLIRNYQPEEFGHWPSPVGAGNRVLTDGFTEDNHQQPLHKSWWMDVNGIVQLRPGVAVCPGCNSRRRGEELKPRKFPYKMTVATYYKWFCWRSKTAFGFVTAARVFENLFSKTPVWALFKHLWFPPHRTTAWHTQAYWRSSMSVEV